MPNKLLTLRQRDLAVQVALDATAAAMRGERTYTRGKHVFDLTTGGRCQQFVGQCVEAGAGWDPHTWEFRDNEPNAKTASAHMRAAGLELPRGELLIPGDILAHERGPHGHIVMVAEIVDGKTWVAENTSSGKRGNPRRPGTKRTPLKDIVYDHAYRLVKAQSAGVFVNGKPVHPVALLLDGRCYVPRRKTAEALGAVLEPIEHQDAMVNGYYIYQIIRDGLGWCCARDLAEITGATVAWKPGRVEFTTKGGK
jgi:hypothetical protein